MRLVGALVLGLTTAAMALPASAQPQRRPTPPLVVTPLSGGVYWTKGAAGSNTGIIVGTNGVAVIDTKMTEASVQDVLAAIAKITPHPVRQIILTHSDGDHNDGLPFYPGHPIIIAQENQAKDMEGQLARPDIAAVEHPIDHPVSGFLPTVLVKDRKQLVLDGVTVELLHTARGHTAGDLVIFLPKQKIAFIGDIVVPNINAYPVVHMHKRGSSLGVIKATRDLLVLGADIYIPGHGEPLTRAMIQARVEAAQQRWTQIKAMVDQHKSLAEIKAALGEPPVMDPGAATYPNFASYIETTYQELTNPDTPLPDVVPKGGVKNQ